MDKKTFYITKSKLEELKQEYARLVAVEHQKMAGHDTPKVFESEELNAEFVSFQEDVGFLRGRIDELKNVIDNHELIKVPPKAEQDIVAIGAHVTVDVDGGKDQFTVVGTLEANPDLGKISNESPVGKALLGKRIGDEVVIQSPVKKAYKIRAIKYEIS